MNLTIRRAEPDDYEAVWRNFEHEGSFAGTLQTPFPSKEAWRKRLAELPEGDFMRVACVDGRIVGNAGLNFTGKSPRRAHAMHLGMTVEGTHKAYALRAGKYVDSYSTARVKPKQKI